MPSRGRRRATCSCSVKQKDPTCRCGPLTLGSERPHLSVTSGHPAWRPPRFFHPMAGGWPIRSEIRAGRKGPRSSSRTRRTERNIRSRSAAGRRGLATERSCSTCRRQVNSWRSRSQRSQPLRSAIRAGSRRFGIADPLNPRPYDLPDGRIVAVGAAPNAAASTGAAQIQVVLNWFDALKERVPTRR